MTAVLEASGLGKQYRRNWALSDCSIEIPVGHVVGLVGPNGAGKTTLLNLAVGLLTPTAGTISVLGATPSSGPEQLGRVGFVAQDTPTYAGFSVADHLNFGAWMNPTWDADLAMRRIEQLGLDRNQRAGKLSGGQRAQLALTIALAKRPELLILDEPVASLDPLARREFLQHLMEAVVEHELSVVLSSHLVADLERVCDYLIVLAASRVQVAGEVDEILASHRRVSGPRRNLDSLPADQEVIEESHTDKQHTLLIRTDSPILDPAWTVEEVGLEDVVLAYMARGGELNRRQSRIRVMIRLAWRQFRTEAIISGGALTVVAVVLAITGPHLSYIFHTDPDQIALTDPLLQAGLGALLVITPPLIGLFFGAPLIARELETGTYRLAWTQSVTRTHWLVVKLALIGLASSLLAGGLSLMATWWSNPINMLNQNRFGAANFGMLGIVPVGYGLFAFVLGATTGLLFRKTLAAMATTLVCYVGVREIVASWVRPHFEAPVRAIKTLSLSTGGGFDFQKSPSGITVSAQPPSIPNGWGLSAQVVDRAGHAPTTAVFNALCPGFAGPNAGGSVPGGTKHAVPAPDDMFQSCISHLATKFHEVVTYQPASRYWAFQGYELSLFVLLSLALAGTSLWWIRHRLT